MGDEWDEIKRLATEFQHIQQTNLAERLAERNWVEIVSWLVERHLIDLIFTTNGKEYVTPQQLRTEIKAELQATGGRLYINELCGILGVDYSHVSTQVNMLLKSDKGIQSIMGQVFNTSYIQRIAVEINEKLQQFGIINAGDLSFEYDLPTDFILRQVLEKFIGGFVQGTQDSNDPNVFFTDAFVARNKAKLRGCLAAITKPTPVATILSQIGMKDRLFFSIFDQSSSFGTLTSRLPGALYVPNCYARAQNEVATTSFKENGFLAFTTLKTLGISDYKTYMKKHFEENSLVFLKSIVVSTTLLDRLEADIDECLASKSYLELESLLPSVFEESDISLILDKVLVGHKREQVIIYQDFIVSQAYFDQLIIRFEDYIQEQAKATVDSGYYQEHFKCFLRPQPTENKFDEQDLKSDKREERRKKAAGGKSGGGTQGRETKTKSVKKVARSGFKTNFDDELEEQSKRVSILFPREETDKKIEELLGNEIPEQLLGQMTQELGLAFTERGKQIAETYYQSLTADKNAERRRIFNETQDKLNEMMVEVRLFSKGLKLLPNETQAQLTKYLQKTLCNAMVWDMLVCCIPEFERARRERGPQNDDQWVRALKDLPADTKAPLLDLASAMSAENIDDFTTKMPDVMSHFDMMLKKIDKKKDRTVVLNHKHKLLEELNACEDVALVLHLATLVIFISATQNMVHASGGHVADLLKFLKPMLPEEQFTELMMYHDFIVLMFKRASEAENAKEKLKEKMPIIKAIANEYKYTTAGRSTQN